MPAIAPLLVLLAPMMAERRIDYTVSFPNRAHHEAVVTATFRDIGAGALRLRMSRSSPGRYRLHEFARNVYDLKAFDSTGKELTIRRTNPHGWNIRRHDGTVRVRYSVFGDLVSGTYNAIDATHAHLNGPATWLWARGFEHRPIRLQIELPAEDWSVATQLAEADQPNVYAAPNLAYLMDSPIEMGPLSMRQWQVQDDEGVQEFRLAMHHDGTEEQIDWYAQLAAMVVREQQGIFGELPEFDYGGYTFIGNYLPYAYGDAMEHRNSTTLCSTGSLARNPLNLLETLSHEFFHVWNVERLRPASLEPFKFSRANHSGELWFAEGFTNYYDGLALHRAGIWSLDRYAEDLTTTVDTLTASPAPRHGSPVDMSLQAAFRDRATWADPQNSPNTFLSYYFYGDAVALALDLTLRSETSICLDDYMQALWRRFGRSERPYTNRDLEVTLGEATGDAGFAQTFFHKHVYGRELADYKSLLAKAGFRVRPANPGAASWGKVRLAARGGAVTINSAPLEGSPLYESGLTRGARLIRIDGSEIATAADAREIVASKRPEDTLVVEYEQRLEQLKANVKLIEDPSIEIVPFEHADLPLDDAAKSFREDWLGSRTRVAAPKPSRKCESCQRVFPLAAEFCPFDGEPLGFIAAEREVTVESN